MVFSLLNYTPIIFDQIFILFSGAVQGNSACDTDSDMVFDWESKVELDARNINTQA